MTIAQLIPKPASTYNYITAPDAFNALWIPSTKSASGPARACLTYNVNALQSIPARVSGQIAISLDAFTPPHPMLVQGVWEYTVSPALSAGTPDAIAKLPSIQNKRGISFCLGWTGCGFWEDAVTSGLMVAIEHLGARVPFVVDEHRTGNGRTRVQLRLRDHCIRTLLRLAYVYILLLQVIVHLALLGIIHLPGRGMRRLLFGEKLLLTG